MTSALRCLSSVQPRLLQHAGAISHPQAATGWLVGLPSDGGVIVTSILRSGVDFDKIAQLRQDIEDAGSLLPAGLNIVGAYVLMKTTTTTDKQATDLCICSWVALQTCLKVQVLQACQHPHLLAQLLAQPAGTEQWLCLQSSNVGSSQLYCAVLTADSVSWFQLLNATTVKPVIASVIEHSSGKQSTAQNALTQQDSMWLSSAFTKVFCSMAAHLHVCGAESAVDQSSGRTQPAPDQLFKLAIKNAVVAVKNTLCSASTLLVASPSGPDAPKGGCSCGDLNPGQGQALDVQVLSRGVFPPAPAQPPAIVYQAAAGGSCSYATSTLNLSILGYVPNDLPVSQLMASVIQPAIRTQLDALQRKLSASGKLQPWTAFQVQPPGWPHCLTLMYPLPLPAPSTTPAPHTSTHEEEELRAVRRALHTRLGLPPNRPLLRLSNAVDPRLVIGPSQGVPGGKVPRLQDVHVGIPPPPVSGGTLHMIEGSYDYHHYMQDKTDDTGWGCAYRSLQTIHSWFRCQHYTHTPVPSLKDIQQTLVDIGDKPQAFVGSRQWIGAIELGYVLDQLLGATHKVITVSTGAEMSSKAREIAQHFDRQGTPIMIGGGVLAYTLLGISHNSKTGECAFLILDPHYTGSEDLARIHSGQWVAWKVPDGKAAAGGPLFVQNAFYNLLCPQRPDMI